jgi:hypothetical protein
MAKKIFVWIYTFQAILRPFLPYDFFFKISKFYISPISNFWKIGIETQVGNPIETNKLSHTTMTFRRTLAANRLVQCQFFKNLYFFGHSRKKLRNISLAPFAPVQPTVRHPTSRIPKFKHSTFCNWSHLSLQIPI